MHVVKASRGFLSPLEKKSHLTSFAGHVVPILHVL